MLLTLVRHGQAHPAAVGQHDFTRELTDIGRSQAEKTAEYIAKHLQPDLFIVSPLLRAQQTLAYIQRHFPNVPVFECDCIKPDDDANIAIEWLSKLDVENYNSIVVVCHMNVIAYMQQLLTMEPLDPYSLAEARVFEQHIIEKGLSTYRQRFIP